jgi:metalloendopeptidase OMA1, mitochondrial
MQAARLGLRATLRSSSRSIPHLRPPHPSPALPKLQQTRFASYRYQRFDGGPNQKQQQWSRIGPIYRLQYLWRNYQKPIIFVGAAGGVFYVSNLEQVPITGRRRFNVIGPDMEKQLALQGYEEILRQYRGKILPPNHPYTEMAARVVERLLPASGLQNEEWRVHVIDEPKEINAFVIPGGKVFVFTGLLPIAKDETGLACVLGHEIAHNVAHHVAEKISSGSIISVIAIAISLLLDVSGGLSQGLLNALLSLPNSRTMEREADHIGLLIMAESCYDPNKAIDLWTRMDEANKMAPPEFLSTHPSNYNRRELIKGWLQDAENKYNESGCAVTGRYNENFKDALQNLGGGRRQQARQAPVLVGGRRDDDDEFW